MNVILTNVNLLHKGSHNYLHVYVENRVNCINKKGQQKTKSSNYQNNNKYINRLTNAHNTILMCSIELKMGSGTRYPEKKNTTLRNKVRKGLKDTFMIGQRFDIFPAH